MKNLLILLLTVLSCMGCNKDDNGGGLSALPEATQTGRGIFACLIDGKTFIANEPRPYFNCYYQYIDGGYYFAIGGKKVGGNLRQIVLRSNNAEIEEGGIYPLTLNVEGNYIAHCSFEGYGVGATTETTSMGELEITKFAQDSSIVSGIFWFNVIHPQTQDTVKIREGRFDTKYYR